MNQEHCRRLHVNPDTNIGDLSSRFMLKLRDDLDSNPETCNWRAFLAKAADNPNYRFSSADVERKFGSQVYHGSPSNKMLWELGSMGMTAAELVYSLDKLKLESVLMDIKKYEPIVIVNQPAERKTVNKGEVLELEVKAIGFPYPRYQWFKENEKDWDILDKEKSSILRIRNVSKSDAGVYCCRLHNGDINSQVEFTNQSTVSVEMSKDPGAYRDTFDERPSRYDLIPSFEVQPKNVTVQICDGFILECRVLSKYPVIYDWYKNHEIIKRSDQPFYEVKAAYKADMGTYECRARNQLGETMSDVVKVTVMLGKNSSAEEPIVDPVGPTEIEIISNPKTVIIEFGGDCLFSCEARCSIPLVYQWLKDGVPIEGEIKPSLVLKKVQNYEHQGLYTCMVSIPGTKNIRLSYPASLSIKTNDKPEFNPSDKVALLIGNFDYRCESPLSAPKSDVYTMAEIFRSLDFKVVSLLNLTKLEMQSAVEEFVKLIGSEVYAVFYFCGHGFEEEAKCYLVPPDARHGYTVEDCVCAEDVLSQMQNYTETSPALIVLILDICRIRNLQPPTNREQDAMASNLSNIPMKGNTVFCYATSKGMYAYEDIHNGILVKYLKKYLPKQMSVLDVFTSVQEDIGKESQYYHIQIPEIKSNLLQPRRSLADRISTKGHTKAYNQRTLLWNNAHEKPRSKEIEIPAINGKVLLEFQTEFSNMLTIFCTVMPMTMGKSLKYHLGCIAHLPKTISIFGSVSQVHDDPPKTKIVLQDLQKLTKDLEVQVFVVNTETKQRYEGPKVNLGKPLVGILDLWKPRRQPIECSESM
ncbi:mucosa-associated lymphoid tissue lymphoma translocation protein 1-like [Mytilus californianus]|uniref:mucosa-associated lymphoid tissue lymphoma translocation protein 1-like n=1 Tax=Mytilus californianus TaxID=6549 RepID=UPI00224849C8|nr:mucosa-associated lymphoid tissue lymphoma translocation protein 1-like [Mytilus californianus]